MMRSGLVAVATAGIAVLFLLSAACSRDRGADRDRPLDSERHGGCTPAPASGPLAREQRQSGDLQEIAGVLAVELQRNERGSFADLEIEHEPRFHVVAYFTENGKGTVRPYVRCTSLEGRVRVRPVEATLAELNAALDEASRITEKAWGNRFTTDIDIRKNRAEIIVPDEGRFEAALRGAGAELPEHVVVVEGGLPVPE